jgi:O-antigen ligase|tara:strand:- start:90 stop:1172 length:1083 start_codon:yes stop_codon:yes gene_type:complete
MIVSSLLSDYQWFSLKKSLSLIRFILFSFALCWILKIKKNLIFNLYKILIFIQLLLLVGGIIEIMFDYNVIYGNKDMTPEWSFEHEKISSFFGNESILGSYISRLFPLFIILFLINYPKLNRSFKFLSYLVFIFSAFLIFFSGERLAIFLLIILFSSLILLIKFNYKNILFITFSLLSVVLFFASFENQRQRVFEYTFKQIKVDNNIIFYSAAHHAHFITAYKIFLNNKIIGTGPNTFRKVCKLEKYHYYKNDTITNACTTHPHNFLIQLLSETGILGSIIPISLFFFLMYKFLYRNILKKDLKEHDVKKKIIDLFLIFFIFCLMLFTPNGNFFNNWLNMITFFGFGIYLHYVKNLNYLR